MNRHDLRVGARGNDARGVVYLHHGSGGRDTRLREDDYRLPSLNLADHGFQGKRPARIEHDEVHCAPEEAQERVTKRVGTHGDSRDARQEKAEHDAIDERIVIRHDQRRSACKRGPVAFDANSVQHAQQPARHRAYHINYSL